MTGKILNVEDGKVIIRTDDGRMIMFSIADVNYLDPKPGDWVSAARDGDRWSVSRTTAPVPNNPKKPKKNKFLPVMIGVAAAIALIIGIGIGTSSGKKQSTESGNVSKNESVASTAVSKVSSFSATVKDGDKNIKQTVPSSSPASSISDTNKQNQSSARQDIQIVNSGYYSDVSSYDSQCYVQFAAEIKNPNTDYAASFPTLVATAKASDGSILGTTSQVGMYVMPGDTVALASQIDTGTSVPAKVEFSLSAQSYVPASSLDIPSSSDFKIENVSELQGSVGTKVTGQVTYTGTPSCNTIGLTALYKKDGKIVYSAIAFVDNAVQGTPSAFEINPLTLNVPAHDSVEVLAQYWM